MNSPKLKRVVVGFLVLVLVFSLVGSVFATKASIKNARMILRVNQGDEIERYVQVNNVNEFDVDIELTVAGDLEDYLELTEDNFTLKPGESKQVYFTITAAKSGTTETKINVKFVPVDGGNGVGLSSTVIVIAEKDSFWDKVFGRDDSSGSDDGGSDDSDLDDTTVGTGNVIKDGKSSGLMVFAGILTTILIIIFIILIVIASKMGKEHLKRKKNKSKKGAKKDE